MEADLPEVIPVRLRQKALVLPGLPQGEVAWDDRTALMVIDALAGSTVAIEAGEVVHVIEGRCVPLGQRWSCDRFHPEGICDYAERSREMARHAVVAEVARSGRAIAFVFAFSDQQDAA